MSGFIDQDRSSGRRWARLGMVVATGLALCTTATSARAQVTPSQEHGTVTWADDCWGASGVTTNGSPTIHIYLDDYHASTANGAVIDTWGANGTTAQIWNDWKESNGRWAELNGHSGKALALYDGDGAYSPSGQDVLQWTWLGQGNEEWKENLWGPDPACGVKVYTLSDPDNYGNWFADHTAAYEQGVLVTSESDGGNPTTASRPDQGWN